MKKIISFVLVAIMVLGCVAAFTSCGKKKDDKPVLLVAMSPDFAPMEFYDSAKTGKDAIVGFDVLLANYIAHELGMTLQIKPMDFDACMAAVQANSADIAISGFSWTADRAETFLITDFYVAGENETEQVVISLKDNKFSTAADFAGKKVAGQGGSLQELLIKEQLVTAGATYVPYTSTNECLAALLNGQVDAFAVAKGNGEAFISKNVDTLDFSGFQFVVEEKYKNNVCLVNKTNKDLFDKVNTVLAKAMSEGLYDAWYTACQTYADIKSIDEFGFDADGNKIIGFDENDNPIIGDPTKVDMDSADAQKKAVYESYLAKYKAN